jgi:hypothetical protein
MIFQIPARRYPRGILSLELSKLKSSDPVHGDKEEALYQAFTTGLFYTVVPSSSSRVYGEHPPEFNPTSNGSPFPPLNYLMFA